MSTEIVVVEEVECSPRLLAAIEGWLKHDPLLGKNIIHIAASREACPIFPLTTEESEV